MAKRWFRGVAALLVAAPLSALAADPQIASLVDDPDPVAAGGVYTYTLRVDNNAPDAATNTRLRFSVPAGATFVAAEPPEANCVATTPTQIDCTLGTLGGSSTGDARELRFRWRALGPGPTIAASAVITANQDDNLLNNTQNATTTVIAGADLVLAATGSPSPVAGGGTLTYTFTTSNPVGPNTSGAIALTVNLSPSVTFASASGNGWNCSRAASVVTCTRPGPHPVGVAIPPVIVTGTVTAVSGNVTTSASVLPLPIANGGVTDPELVNNAATVVTPVVAGADVTILSKTVTSGSPAIAGSNVTFLIRPRNAGPADATNVVVSDPLPAGWTYVSASGPNWTCSANVNSVSCTRPVLPVTSVDDIRIVATAPSAAVVGPNGTTYTNTATISSATADGNPNNNSASVSIEVRPGGADLSITKSKSPNPVPLGGLITSTINVKNNGPQDATGPFRVVEVLTNEEFVSASGFNWTCTANANVVVCDNANVFLGAQAFLPTLTIITRSTATGTATNQACTGNSVPPGAGNVNPRPPAQGDPNPTNDCASASVTVTGPAPDLAITKTTSTPLGGDKVVSAAENSVTYTLVVTNRSGSFGATGVRISDSVPAFLANRSSIVQPVPVTVSGGSSATFACSVSTAAVVCSQTGGVLNPGEQATVRITVNRPMEAGSFTNTATVTNTAEGDVDLSNNTASDTVRIDPITDVEMASKTVTPNPVRAGEEASYVFAFRNNGPGIAENVVVSDTFAFPAGDAGVTVMSVSPTRGTCAVAPGDVLSAAGPAGFSCNLGTMAAGEVQSVTLVVRPNFQTGNPNRRLVNTASITTTSVENPNGGDNGNNSKTATLDVGPASLDLLVNKTDRVDPVPYAVNATFIDYRVRVTNNGPSFATNVRVSESMAPPAGKRVRFLCDTTTFSSGVCNPTPLCSVANVTSGAGVPIPTFTCVVPPGTAANGPAAGTLAAGTSKDIFLRFEAVDIPAPTGDVFNNTARVAANEPDVVAANDAESEQTTTRQRIDLKVTKTASVASVSLLQPFTWTVGVTNAGPGNSLQTDLTDTLPPEVEVTGPITWTKTLPAANGTCTRVAQTITCALGQLNAGGAVTVSVPVRVIALPASGAVTNTAKVDTDPNKTGGIDVPPGDTETTNTVPVVVASLSGTVFDDRDRAGANGGTPQATSVDPRIAGVSLRLTGRDAFGNPVDLTTTTDPAGNYRFANLGPADASGYTITETQPAGFVNGPVNPPVPATGGTYAAGGTAGNSSYAAIVLAAGADGVNYNFPELRRVSLSGFVYVDANSNGTRDAAGDPPIAGAAVRLLDAGTLALVTSTTTDAAGAYTFTALDPTRAYVLEEPLPATPANLVNGPVNPGLIGGQPCVSGCTAQPNTPTAGTDRIAAIDLSGGNDGTQFNFGELQRSTISGTVYIDRDRDGTIDPTPTDGRIPGVTLSLYSGGTCTGAALATTTTDASGNYSFTSASAGQTYTVCETQPAGFGEGAVNPGTNGTNSGPNAITITSLPATGSVGNHFGERVATLAGSVYVDANNDGVRQGSEAGIPGVTVTLTGTDASGASITRPATTDANGNYAFADLLAGTYAVTEQLAQPIVGGITTLNGKTAAGSAGGTATPVGTTPSAVTAIALPGGSDGARYDFGEILPVSLAGAVFLDLNGNGTKEASDTGLGAVPLTITGTDDTGAPVTRNISTSADGSYSVTGLRPGTYTITEPTQPSNTANGITTAGTAGGTATPVATVPSVISAIPLTTPGTASTGNNFAEVPLRAVISGTVYVDRDRDNGIDPTPADGRIPGVTITLVAGTSCAAPPGTPSFSTTTDANGFYQFTDVFAGQTYTVCETQPAGYGEGAVNPGPSGANNAPNAITITNLPPTGSPNNHFGELVGSIAGRVYLDANNDGTRQAAEAGIAGVAVTLSGSDVNGRPVTASTTTAPDGSYSFIDLLSGTYAVTEQVAQPIVGGVTTLNGKTTAGSAGGTATAVSVTPSAITGIGLGLAVNAVDNDFGELLPVSLAGTVFTDFDGNGLLDGADTGLGSVPLTITGTDDTGAPVSRNITTGADGTYSVTGLRPGTYTITEPTQPAGTANGITTAGSAGGTATPVATTPSAISGIPLTTPGTASTGNNFAEVPLRATISGTVYVDRDGDGQMDPTPTDGRVPGTTLTLYPGTTCTGTPVATTTTDASGNYSFANVIAGRTYTICETQPVGYGDGGTNPGPNGTSTAPNTITITNLPPTGSSNNQFGEKLSSLAGGVYLDANNDGVRQGSEAGIAGVVVTLTGTDASGASVTRPATTDASGNYVFTDLLSGSYSVTEQAAQPVVGGITTLNGKTAAGSAGGTPTAVTTTPSAVSAITLPAATAATGYQFGEILPVGLFGTVFLDPNDNGVQDNGDRGLENVALEITGTDDTGAPVSRNLTTDNDGRYSVADLRPGTYTITEPNQPFGTSNGITTAGSAGGTATPVFTTPSAISGIPLTTPGSSSTGNNFAERPPAPPPPPVTTISGTVYVDRNGNGRPDPAPTDGRIPGVTLTLYNGTSCSGTPLDTVRSDAIGAYSFEGVVVGRTYTVCETQPAGYGDGVVNPGTNGSSNTPNAITITNLPGSGSSNNQFGEKVSSLAGGVYLDANNDGVRQTSETGLAGVQVTLTGTDATGAPVTRNATTDASGNYLFADLLSGTYVLTEQAAQPVVGSTTTLNGKTTAGTAGGTASSVTATPSTVTAVGLPAGTSATGYQFGEILPVGLSGTVFADADDNGTQTPATEPGLPGVPLVITGTDDTGTAVTRNVTTGPDGRFSVPDLRPGTYTVTEPTQPPNTANGKTTAGSAGGTATPVTTTPSVISGIPLTTPGTTSTGNNFAEIPTSGTISGRVWLDADNDGLVDAAETGIAGVTIELSGPVTRTTTTDANGNYSFTSLPPGSYTLRQPTQPAGTVNGSTVAGSTGGNPSAATTTPSTITAVPLAGANAGSTGNNFGEVPAGSIAGTVWNDLDADGVLDTAEPGLPGVTLVLTGTDDLGRPVSVTVTTGADGRYVFPALRPGTYTVTEPTQPAGTRDGVTLPGSLGGSATPRGTTPSAISAIVLPPGGQSVRNDFAEIADSPDLKVNKSHTGNMTVGRPGTFRITVRNTGELPSTGNYTVSDRLPAGMTLAATPTGTGWACVGAAGASAFSCTSSTVVAVGSNNPNVITAIVDVAAAAGAASPVSNAVLVEGGGEIGSRGPSDDERERFTNDPKTLPLCTSTPSHNACRDDVVVQQPASVAGTVWFDGGTSSRLLDAGDRRLSGWGVEVVDQATGNVIARATTGTDGTYRITDLTPGVQLAVRFRDPASGIVFGYPVNGETAPGSSGAACVASPPPGTPSSCVSTGAQPQLVVVLASGQVLPQQSLPVDPSGVVYDSSARLPVPGAVVTLAPVGTCTGWSPATSVVGATLGGYTVNGNAVSMRVGSEGFYQFLLSPTAPASCTFGLTVAPPSGYSFVSTAIPPQTGPLVPSGGAGTTFNVQPQAGAPTGAVGPATQYWLQITTGSAGANVVHNHIPLDPSLPGGIGLVKTGDRAQAEIGDSVRYSITVSLTSGARPTQTTVVDRLPAGFTYIKGTAMVDGVPIADPQGGVGPSLAFNLGPMPASGQQVLQYRVRVGVGAQEGDGINTARGHACAVAAGCVGPNFDPVPNSVPTNESKFRVRVFGGVFGTDACFAGSLFVDCNHNHVKDPEEIGIPGVRLYLQDGTTLITDSEGKFSMCGLTPNSHVLKVDPSTLPTGSRLTTTSNRNLGDANSIWLDLKNGQLSRADFAEGSCSNRVIEQVKARRALGEVSAPETEKGPALRFDSKPARSPQQGTDSANQPVPRPRATDNNGGTDAKR